MRNSFKSKQNAKAIVSSDGHVRLNISIRKPAFTFLGIRKCAHLLIEQPREVSASSDTCGSSHFVQGTRNLSEISANTFSRAEWNVSLAPRRLSFLEVSYVGHTPIYIPLSTRYIRIKYVYRFGACGSRLQGTRRRGGDRRQNTAEVYGLSMCLAIVTNRCT